MSSVVINKTAANGFITAFDKDPCADEMTKNIVQIFQESIEEGKVDFSKEELKDGRNFTVLFQDPFELNAFVGEMQFLRENKDQKPQSIVSEFALKVKDELDFGVWSNFAVATVLSLGAWFGMKCAVEKIATMVDTLARKLISKVHQKLSEKAEEKMEARKLQREEARAKRRAEENGAEPEEKDDICGTLDRLLFQKAEECQRANGTH